MRHTPTKGRGDSAARTIDLTPSWQAAARVCIMVLRNPHASAEATNYAEREIMRLAKHVDDMQSKNKAKTA